MLHAHLVFVTKYRHPVFIGAHPTRLEEIFRSVCADFECELVEFHGETNHVHLLVNFPRRSLAGQLASRACPPGGCAKSSPSWSAWRAKRLWSGSSVAGSVGSAPISLLRPIEQQNRPI